MGLHLNSRKQLVLTQNRGGISCVTLDVDDQYLLASSMDGSITCFDMLVRCSVRWEWQSAAELGSSSRSCAT